MLPALHDALQSSIETDNDPDSNEPMGWALGSRKKASHFSTNVCNFLKEKFEEGERSGNKWNGNRLSPIMRTLRENGVPKFSHTELLTAQQIQ